MRVLVCGPRHFNDYEFARRILSGIHITEIISGNARGADSLGERYAKENSINCLRFPALWDTYGRRAGPIRNSQMLREGTPDLVVAFKGPNSRGTQDMINKSIAAGIPIKVIEIE